MPSSALKTRRATPGRVADVFAHQADDGLIVLDIDFGELRATPPESPPGASVLSMVSETLTSEVATMSTAVSKRSNTSKMRRRKPCAISMRVEWMFTSVILRLQAIDLTALPQCTDSATMRVPSTSGRREFRISTGMFFSTAGTTVAGCSTLAPK